MDLLVNSTSPLKKKYCYWTKLGTACMCSKKKSTDTGLWRRKVQCLLQGPSKGSRQPVLKRSGLPDSFQGRVFKDRVSGKVCRVHDYLMDILQISWWWGNGSQHHQPSGSKPAETFLLVGSTQLTSSTWWGFQYLQNSSKDMAQNMSYSP